MTGVTREPKMRAQTYLQRSPKTGVYRVRRFIPEDVRPAFGGRREYVQSLGTRNLRQAKSLAMPILAELQSRMDASAENGCANVIENRSSHSASNIPVTVIKSSVVKDHQVLSTSMSVDRHDQRVASRSIPQSSPSETASRTKPGLLKNAPAIDGKTISELSEALLTSRAYKDKTIPDVRRAYALLIELHGDLPIRQVTRSHIRELRDVLLRYPVTGRTAEVESKSIRQIVQRNWDRTISRPTVEKLLGFISQGFRLGLSEGWCDENPRQGIIVGKTDTSIKTERSDFQPHHLLKLFGSPLFSGCEGDHRVYQPGHTLIRDYRFWLPVVGLFTGARLGELCQLEVGDLRQDQGTWFLQISSISDLSAGSKSLKTKHSERVVPLHRQLVELGFVQYARSSASGHIFDSRYDSPRKLSHEYSKWFGRYLTKIGLIERELVFHSFRHTFKTACRLANVPTEIHDELTGHKPVTVGGWYGERKRRMEFLKDIIDSLRYDGLPAWMLNETDDC
jgi:integrase